MHQRVFRYALCGGSPAVVDIVVDVVITVVVVVGFGGHGRAALAELCRDWEGGWFLLAKLGGLRLDPR